MYNSITVSPAYGRDYKSKKAVLDDWNAGKDFNMEGLHSGYVNKAQESQLVSDGYTHIHFRYKNMTQVCVVAI